MRSFRFILKEQRDYAPKDELNPSLWENDSLKINVKEKLLAAANVWKEFQDIPEDAITDIILVGSNANYNYLDTSDVDIHVVVDSSELVNAEIDQYLDLYDEYFRDKKLLWALTHDVSVFGHPVEFFVEIGEKPRPQNQGVYSLMSNQWISKPEKIDVEIDMSLVLEKVNQWKDLIDSFEDGQGSLDTIKETLEHLYDIRQEALQRGGEYTIENLMFKELRNLGYTDKLRHTYTKLFDKNLSLEKDNT